ncbi:virulence factor TspB C-terminal domain-related protein [Acinetobacter ursingii]|uniref:virulence factor TspB C-terminal domain-related protein n=1 Tax=Acinetobacter ursingii TaxID=108980 RepID=UPI002E17B59E|nr:virulence factor TspB C-terminal domain-related protein [Acinetobacter ursingii]
MNEFDTKFEAYSQCPPNPVIDFPIVGSVELPFSRICDFFSYLRYGVLTGASLLACWIISAAVRGGEA